MLDDLAWPDPRDLIYALLDSLDTVSGPLAPRYEQAANEYGEALGPWPEAVIYTSSTTEGYIDRVHAVSVDVYAPRGPDALRTAEQAVRALVGTDLQAGGVYADRVGVRTGPVEVPYPHPSITQVTFSLDVTVRPID